MQTLKDIGELKAISRLTALLNSVDAADLGPGDDCAIVSLAGQDLVLTSDPVIADVHFTASTPPESIGHKAVGRALSDLAAMSAVPVTALINIVATPQTDVAFLEDIYRGVNSTSQRYGLSIAGGDIAQGKSLELHVFAVGQLPTGSAIRRSGAQCGDAIYVTGTLGGSALGGHLTFEPRIAAGIWLREHHPPSAMIDLSDGLATDLRHLLECSHAGARLYTESIPVSAAASALTDNMSALDHALSDGEDFELVFTMAAQHAEMFEHAWKAAMQLPCTRIGEITAQEEDLVLVDSRGQPTLLTTTAFEHFKTLGMDDST